MQISLLPEEVDYIYSLVRADVKLANWIRTHILNKIESSWEQEQHNSKCQHEKGLYLGKKECCAKCGSYFEEGQGESWELVINKEPKKLDIGKAVKWAKGEK